ncbi:MAG: pyridoxamine 5'-phosphate oxidase [Planctomycetaceae bacterium]|nr:pyridoxamine 5'-phosphate oxidase [Planctomycetaceae bacterium]
MEDLRKQYTLAGISDAELLDDPIEQLRQWFQIAQDHVPADWVEPNAVTLATASLDGRVSARMVLLKGIEPSGVLFYTNYDSQKGRQLAENPYAALVLYWPYLERQVRIVGGVEMTDRETSERYFHSRPRGSQIGAAISAQSAPIDGRGWLERRAAELEAKLEGKTVPVPENWGGYRLQPNELEFWQGRENRLHDRIRYLRSGSEWQRCRIAP